jgi:hypothetical protein
MRTSISLLPLVLIATPVAAQAPASQPPAAMQRALNDPALAERLTNAMQALSTALLDLPVGGLEAALEGRQATETEKRRTIRDIEPGIDVDLQRQVAEAKPMMRQGMKAMADALPAMMKSLEEARRSLERAAANMPDPTYPKR